MSGDLTTPDLDVKLDLMSGVSDKLVSKVMRAMSRKRRTHGGPARKPCQCKYCGKDIAGVRQNMAHEAICKKRPPRLGGRPPTKSYCEKCEVTFRSITAMHAHRCPLKKAAKRAAQTKAKPRAIV